MLVSRPGLSSRMIGRRSEVAELGRLMAQSHRQASPIVAMVTGEAGVGKTRMLHALVGEAPPETRILSSQAQEGTSARPFALVREAVEEHLPLDGDVPQAVERWAHPLGHLLAPTVVMAEHPQDSHVHGEEELTRAAVALVNHLVGRGPALVAFEDLHWADAASLEVMGRLARSEVPALLVGTFRPEEFERRHPLAGLLATLERQRPVVHMPVERLTPRELAELVEDACQEPVSSAVVDRLHRRTGGNPFFVEELLATAGDASVGPGGPSPLQDLGMLVQAPLPWNTTEAVLRRLEGYEQATASLLRTAAALGERFTLGLLAAVRGVDEDEAAEGLQHLIETGVLLERGPDVFVFRHVLVREAVAGELLSRERRAVHERALEWLVRAGQPEPALASYHAAEAGREAEAAQYARTAASAALHGGAPGNALALARQALAHVEGDVALHALATKAATQVGELHEAAWHGQQWAAAASDDPSEQTRACCQLAWIHWWNGEPERGWQALDTATRLAAQLEQAERVEVAATHVQMLLMSGHATQAVEEADRAIELAERADDQRTRARVFVTKASALVDSLAHQEPEHMAESAALTQRSRHESAALGDVENVARALHLRLVPDQPTDLPMSEAQEVLAEAKDLADRYGMERFSGKLAVIETHLNIREGLQAQAERTLALAQRARLWPAETAWRARLEAYLAMEQGDPDRARAIHAAQRERLADRKSGEAEFDLAAVESALAAAEPDAPAAEAALRRAGAAVEAVCPCVAADWWEMAVAALDAGVDPAAVETLAERQAPAPVPRHAGLIDHALGCLDTAQHRIDDAIGRFEQSVTRPRSGRRAALLADTHARLAELLGRRGDRQAARANVDAGLALLSQWPGPRRTALEALARRIGEQQQPAHALMTTRELEVVRLLTRGHSNAEIAEELFIARKTAATHVSNILDKTGFDRRTQVATWALQHGVVDPPG